MTAKQLLSPELRDKVELEQLRLSVEQHRRVALPHFLASAVVAFVAQRIGVDALFLGGWLVVTAILQLSRFRFVSRAMRDAHPTPAVVSHRLSLLAAWLYVMGGVNSLAAIVIFNRPLTPEHMLLSMILVGNAAGTISIVAGQTRVFGTWALLSGGALSFCWARQGTWEGAAIGALAAALFLLLTLNVRDQRRMLVELVSVSDKLRIERDRAEMAAESKTRFFASASHDLRQPLTALSYHATTIQALAHRNEDAVLKQVGDGVSRALSESQSLLDSLLEVSQLDAGAVSVRREDVRVAELAGRVVDEARPIATARGLTLRCLVSPGSSGQVVNTDPALLRRILQNLVSNAIKFTPQGCVELLVTTSQRAAAEKNGVVLLEVRDTGLGIPAAAQERIFEEFFQLDNADRDRGKGLGLGLSIVKRMTHLLGASIDLESVQGQGSTFRLSLPIGEGVVVSTGAAASEPVPVRPRFDESRRRALLVDDEPEVRTSLALLLGEMNWEGRAARDAAEALLHLTAGFSPDVLLVDFRLRDGASGLDALEAMRAAGCTAPALLITGDTEPGRIAEARAAGIEVLYKPVNGTQLIERMNMLVAASSELEKPV